MPRTSRRESSSRAELRRRARQLERGDETETGAEADGDGSVAQAEARPKRPSLLTSIFPAAPPLPNRPDPLADFHYTGPLANVAAWFYLLGRNPRAWLLPAIPWAAAQTLTMFTPGAFVLPRLVYGSAGVLAALAAGWIGWQRPWLFGVAAAIVGTLIQAVFLALVPGNFAQGTAAGWFFSGIALNLAQFTWVYAAVMGWYAGYFRRRLAAQRPPPARSRRR
jgi:hypothetical protein